MGKWIDIDMAKAKPQLIVQDTGKYLEDTDFRNECEQLAEKIFKGPKNKRPLDVVMADTAKGLMGEMAFCEAYPQFNRSPDGIISHDVSLNEIDGTRVEIKVETIDSNWWNIGTKKNGESQYTFFYHCVDKGLVDWIVRLYLDDGGNMHVKYLAEADSFESYVVQSNYGDGTYFNVIKAIQDGVCWAGKDAIKEIKELERNGAWKNF